MSLTVQHNFINKNDISCNSGIDTKTMTDCGAHDLLVKGSHVPYPCASVFNFFQQESFATFVAEIEKNDLKKRNFTGNQYRDNIWTKILCSYSNPVNNYQSFLVVLVSNKEGQQEA